MCRRAWGEVFTAAGREHAARATQVKSGKEIFQIFQSQPSAFTQKPGTSSHYVASFPVFPSTLTFSAPANGIILVTEARSWSDIQRWKKEEKSFNFASAWLETNIPSLLTRQRSCQPSCKSSPHPVAQCLTLPQRSRPRSRCCCGRFLGFSR